MTRKLCVHEGPCQSLLVHGPTRLNLIPCISKATHACSVQVIADCKLGWPIYTLCKNQHISLVSALTSSSLISRNILCSQSNIWLLANYHEGLFLKPGHWIWNHVNQKEIKYISDSNIRATVDTPYTIYSVGSPALPSQTFYRPPSSSLAKFCNTHISREKIICKILIKHTRVWSAGSISLSRQNSHFSYLHFNLLILSYLDITFF